MTKLRAVSLFSGCGGFDIGAREAGLSIVWANDIDPIAELAYRSQFPRVKFVPGDVREIREFPEADVVIGCYPCTGFSLGSRRKWRSRDKRDLFERDDNFLFRELVRAVGKIRPRYVIVENVRGMASAESGWFLKQQLRAFRRLGYAVSHQMLDAVDYGAPQNRKRVFIIGVRDTRGAMQYQFPEPTHGPGCGGRKKTLADAIRGWEDWPHGEFFVLPFHGHYLTRNRKRGWDEPSYSIVANLHHVPLHPLGLPMKYVKKDTWALQGSRNRRLSWRECAAIQSLPSSMAPTGFLDDKYRVVGNAVPPPLARAIVLPIVNFELRKGGRSNSMARVR